MISLVEEQHYLAKYAHIGLAESASMPDFEREAHLNMILRKLKEEAEAKQKAQT